MNKDVFQLKFNNEYYPIPLDFYHYHNVSQNILQIFVNDPNHQYQVQTKVPESIFQEFIGYLVKNKIPNINDENFYLYFQLCEEFEILDLILQKRSEFNEHLININGLRTCKKDFLTKLEEEIASNLDEYLENSGEILMKSPIQSLSRIFNHKKCQLKNHNLAYELIKQQFENSQDPTIFILLDKLDGLQLSEQNLEESLELVKLRCKFMPHIDFSYLSMQFKKLFFTNKIHEEQIKKLNEKYQSNGLNQMQKQIFIYKIVLFILFMVLCLTFYKNDKINQSQKFQIYQLIESVNSQQKLIEHLNQTFLSQKKLIEHLNQTSLSQKKLIEHLNQTSLSQEVEINNLKNNTYSQKEQIYKEFMTKEQFKNALEAGRLHAYTKNKEYHQEWEKQGCRPNAEYIATWAKAYWASTTSFQAAKDTIGS